MVILPSYQKNDNVINGSFPVSEDAVTYDLTNSSALTELTYVDEPVVDGYEIGYPLLGGFAISDVHFNIYTRQIMLVGAVSATVPDTGQKLYQVLRVNLDGSIDDTFVINRDPSMANYPPFQRYLASPNPWDTLLEGSPNVILPDNNGRYYVGSSLYRVTRLGSIESVAGISDLRGRSGINFLFYSKYTESYVYGIIRFNSDGSRDNTFTLEFPSPTVNQEWYDIIYLPSKDSVVGTGRYLNLCVWNNTGTITLSSPDAVGLNGLAHQTTTDEFIVFYNIFQTSLQPLNPRGLKKYTVEGLNASESALYGTGIQLMPPWITYGLGGINGKYTPNGQYYVCSLMAEGEGDAYQWNGNVEPHYMLMKIYPDGSTPSVYTDFRVQEHRVIPSACATVWGIDTIGRIYVNGGIRKLDGVVVTPSSGDEFVDIRASIGNIWRLNSDGSWDQSFSLKDKVPSGSMFFNCKVISDNHLIVCGTFLSYQGNTNVKFFAHIDANGNLLKKLPS